MASRAIPYILLLYMYSLYVLSVLCFPHLVQLLSADGKKKTFHYTLNVPTAAPCIAFVIG